MSETMARPFLAPSLSLLALSLFAAACSRSHRGGEAETPRAAPAPSELSAPPLEAGSAVATSDEPRRRVGDLRVVRFSGSFHKGGLILREEVVAANDATITIDYTLDDGFAAETLRVVHTRQSERVVEVRRKAGESFLPAAREDFDALLAQTSFFPSQNQGEMDRKDETCLVGIDEYECSVRQYAVLVGEEEATLRVSRASELDLAGEVVAVDGTLLYRAQTLELRRGDEAPSESGASVASK